MRTQVVDRFVEGLKRAGISVCCYLPDSWLAPLESRVAQGEDFISIPVVNEGEGVAICAGVWLGGKRAVMLMENSGVRVACEELARLGLGQGVPVFMIMPFRGDVGDGHAWAQPHAWTMAPVLDALRADYRVIRREDEIIPGIVASTKTMAASKNHVALIIGRELCDDEPEMRDPR